MILNEQWKQNIRLIFQDHKENVFLVYTIIEAAVCYWLMLQKSIYQFKSKDSAIKKFPLCLGTISKDSTSIN